MVEAIVDRAIGHIPILPVCRSHDSTASHGFLPQLGIYLAQIEIGEAPVEHPHRPPSRAKPPKRPRPKPIVAQSVHPVAEPIRASHKDPHRPRCAKRPSAPASCI